ncbi:MAG: glycerol kinase, partial [Chloroflexi bacterium]|nr:glycerol kinase [Chloroflexota bacterium]
MPEHILAIDQGTTSTRAIVFDSSATPVASAQVELSQHFPQPGWVEHDPIEIAEAAVSVAKQAIGRARLAPGDIAAIGITNQRETTIVWERSTGRPVANAIVWQD